MILVFTFDKNYLKPFLCTFRSLLNNKADSTDIVLYIIYNKGDNNGIGGAVNEAVNEAVNGDEDVLMLNFLKKQLDLAQTEGKLASYKIIEFDPSLITDFPIKPTDHVSLSTYIRLFLGQLLPPTLDKVLYLDCDLIIQCDLDELWSMEFEEGIYLVGIDGGRSNPAAHYDHFSNFKDFEWKSFQVFNAGVILINLAQWRQDNLFDSFKACISDNQEHLRYHDQDVLNYCCHEHWQSAPSEWNYCLNVNYSMKPFTKHDNGNSKHNGSKKNSNKYSVGKNSSKSSNKGKTSKKTRRFRAINRMIPDQVKIVHYNTRQKPWQDVYPIGPAKELWQNYWIGLPELPEPVLAQVPNTVNVQEVSIDQLLIQEKIENLRNHIQIVDAKESYCPHCPHCGQKKQQQVKRQAKKNAKKQERSEKKNISRRNIPKRKHNEKTRS